MKKRYSIMVQEFGSDHEVELCQVEQGAEQIVAAAKAKTLMVHDGKKNRRTKMSKYLNVRMVENV